MNDISNFCQNKLLENGFQEEAFNEFYSPIGKLFRLQKEQGEGVYWVYGQKDLYDIKIHDFYFYKDFFFDLEVFGWPESLSITYYESVSGEEMLPTRRLSPGCVKAFIGGGTPYKALFHKNTPIRCIGIEIMPAYYEKYLKEAYSNEYIPPRDMFRKLDQTYNFPEMVSLLRQVWNYRGSGLAAKLFYEAKVAEAVSLVFEYSRNSGNQKPYKESRITAQDVSLLEAAASYIDDHFNCELSLEHLSHIACMGTTKLKSSFKQVYDCTITEYILKRRFRQAENLLSSTDLTVEQIAKTVGYSNSGRFAGSFRKSTGFYPAEYRKRAQRA